MGNSGLKSKITHQILGTNFPRWKLLAYKMQSTTPDKRIYCLMCTRKSWRRWIKQRVQLPISKHSISLSQSTFSATTKPPQDWAASTASVCFSQLWEVNGQGMGRLGVWRRPTSCSFSLCPHKAERAREHAGVPLMRAVISLMRSLSSWPKGPTSWYHHTRG